MERKECSLCDGILLVTWYYKGGKRKMRSLCVTCGARFNEAPSQFTLKEVNEIRKEHSMKLRMKLRKKRRQLCNL